MEKGTGFEVVHHESVAPDDPRGPLFEWKLPENRQVTVCVREEGVEGGHYHKGEDPSKNPERIFIAAGRVRVTLFDERGNEIRRFILTRGFSLDIRAGIRHHFKFLERTIILEYRVTHFDPEHPDTYPI